MVKSEISYFEISKKKILIFLWNILEYVIKYFIPYFCFQRKPPTEWVQHFNVKENMEYAIEYSMAYSKIFHKKKKIEISKFETSDLTTRMVLAKGKKKLPHSLSL